MLSTATLQHNLAALQTQLETLQHENSALTRDLCLKENYIELKDQQFRVMQRRLEELEGTLAQWKDRWLQQVNTQQATLSRSSRSSSSGEQEKHWTPWKCKPGGASRAKGLAQAAAKLEKVSEADRNKLLPLLTMIEQEGAGAGDGIVDDVEFVDVSEELSRILLLYLLPALLDAVGDRARKLQCFSRTYRKQTMDFRVCINRTADTASTGVGGRNESRDAVAAREKLLLPSGASAFGASSTAFSDDQVLAQGTQPAPETEEGEVPHLFDCVELDRRGAACTFTPHGSRELHATKAMFISRPLSASAATQTAVSPPLDRGGEKLLDDKLWRYTLTPKRTGPTFTVDSARTQTMTVGALPSPAQSPSLASVFRIGSDGDAIPTPPRESKDGKIKKIVGSVFDRLSRHKSQQSLTTNSLFHASPVPLRVSVGAIDVAGDDDESICDGCGRGPLLGVKWVCRTCRLLADTEYEICEKCYGQGIHGKEHDDALFTRVESIVVRKCPQLAAETELLHLLRIGICKANLKKFSFCLTWIADLLQCKRTTDLRARALEIAHISPTVRSEFARILRELLARYRPNIELKTEWEPAAGVQHSAVGPGTTAIRCEGVSGELDTLRIWVKDAPLAIAASSGVTGIGPPPHG
uniref:ZZ-type domain-containing protein n=1 Tax=Hyaloperonospora arabidopsidis (strain Emoy2) TaxID=559515 RepID=M4BLJ5_HYAAE